MNIIVCVDDNGGMLFNHRRQSCDEKVVIKILEILNGKKLWIRSFSKNLFPKDVVVDDAMLEKASSGEFCFVEDMHLAAYIEKIEQIYVFKWNRKYPSDFELDIQPDQLLRLETSEDFTGNSHEKITLEVWSR